MCPIPSVSIPPQLFASIQRDLPDPRDAVLRLSTTVRLCATVASAVTTFALLNGVASLSDPNLQSHRSGPEVCAPVVLAAELH